MENKTEYDEMIKLLEETKSLAVKLEENDAIAEITQASHYFVSGQFYVLVCGEVKRGKSTLINAYLNEPDLCPVGDKVTTQAISLISWAEEERVVAHQSFYNANDKLEKQEKAEISRNEIAEFSIPRRNGGLRIVTELFEIFINNERLKGGLTLVDSPGVGSMDPRHAAITASFLPNADAAICVGDAKTPLGITEVKFFTTVAKVVKKILLVTTHSDVGDADMIASDSLHKLKQALGEDLSNIDVFQLSSTVMADYWKNGNQQDYVLSGFDEFDKGMNSIIHAGETLLRARVANILLNVCHNIRTPLADELNGIESGSPESIEELKKQFEALQKQYQELITNEASWKNRLYTDMSKLENNANRFLSTQFNQMSQTLDKYLEDDYYLNNSNALESAITTDFTLIATKLIEKVSNDATAVYQELREITRLDGKFGYAQSFAADIVSDLNAGDLSIIDTALVVGRNIGIGALAGGALLGSVGAVLGGIVGTFLAPGAGTLLLGSAGAQIGAAFGGIVGTMVGWFKSPQTIKEEKRKAFKAAAAPLFKENQTTLSHALRETIIECRAAISEQLHKDIKDASTNIKRRIEALNRALLASSARQKELQTLVRQFDELMKSYAMLVNAASTQSNPEN